MDIIRSASAFSALGHPSRVLILRLLVQAGEGGLSVSQMREHLDMPATTFGHHLKAMAEAGLVKQQRKGRSLISFADYSVLRDLIAFLMDDCCRGVLTSELTQALETT